MQADPLPLETLRMMQYQAWQQMARGEKETPNLWIVPQSRNLMKFVCFLSSFFLGVFKCVYHYSKVWRSIYFHLQHSQIGDAMFLSFGQLNLSCRHNFDKENIRRVCVFRGTWICWVHFSQGGFVEVYLVMSIHSIDSNPGLRYKRS